MNETELEYARKRIIEITANFAFFKGFCSREELYKDYSKNIVSILRFYRSSKTMTGYIKNLLNQMIVNDKYIPFFEILISKKKNVKRIIDNSKEKRIRKMIDKEKEQQFLTLEEKTLPTLIEEAKQRIEEAKQYLSIVSDKLSVIEYHETHDQINEKEVND